jgi:outer membrane beta-barrel protein
MDNRFQHILLTTKLISFVFILGFSSVLCAEDEVVSSKTDISNINNEVFELGLFAGLINIQDFTSEFVPGISFTFRASEDFFVQYNYLEAEVGLSSYEESAVDTNVRFSGSDRKFIHYDLLVGYNIFQGEFFPNPPKASLSSLYLVLGVGNTDFGDESKFTYTAGLGYQVALTRRFAVHFDYRDYIYERALFTVEETVHNSQISVGLKFAF